METTSLRPQRVPSAQPSSRAQRAAPPKAVAASRPSVREPRPENKGLDKEGAFFVDHTCIDCDTCRWMNGSVFSRVGDMTAVTQQPRSQQERVAALEALLACPTHSIHAGKAAEDMQAALDNHPRAIPGCDNTWHCGFHSDASYGAASYLVTREGGNVLFDSPRFDPRLLKRIQARGGAKYIALSHRDDVCDHAKWAEALGAQRIIHSLEANRSQGTDQCEIQLEGRGPWQLPDGGDDVSLIHTPGHTRGHVCLYFKPDRALLTGDHLYLRASGQLSISRAYNWYSVSKQLDSMQQLQGLEIRHLLPGHGRPGAIESAADQEALFAELLERER